MVYDPKQIEPKWQEYWQKNDVYKTEIDHNKPKYYTLDMFPYPSGKGLHIGHPLGYTASDIMARYKRMKGFNVLHPMGFDSFGLPAEQHAIDTGQHPAVTTEQNIATFKSQLSKLGFCFDWSREIQTSSPEYYKWTQWIFMQLFNSWFNYDTSKAEAIDTLYAAFEKNGNQQVNAACDDDVEAFTAEEWKAFSEEEKYKISLQYRLTYVADSVVNWCPALGTVLANDEIKDGVSERGGHPVERKKMKQWSMRITAYADRLLQGLDKIEWSAPLKEMQRNWIGKSHGAEMDFKVEGHDVTLTCFTTRPDTIFGVTFMVMAPEHDLVAQLTTPEQKAEVEAYVEMAKNRSERERQSEVKRVSGVFTGSYVINPISGEKAPLWVADYVLAGYGTGVVMAVPGGDERDFRFARHFGLPVTPVVKSTKLDDQGEVVEANPTKDDVMVNSGFLDGMTCLDAIQAVIKKAEADGTGKGKVNFRLRDAVFSRQRYWGEPVPAYFKNDLPYMIKEEELPLTLPEISEYKPTADGDPPLGRAEGWLYQGQYPYELTTMPGWAGSSWYFARYMDATNDQAFVSNEKAAYWNQVDLYIGGTEHAVGHLLYSRFWAHFLNDRGFLPYSEPFKKLINQGMIQGNSALIVRLNDFFGLKELFVSVKVLKKVQKLREKIHNTENKFNQIAQKIAESIPSEHINYQTPFGKGCLDARLVRPKDFPSITPSDLQVLAPDISTKSIKYREDNQKTMYPLLNIVNISKEIIEKEFVDEKYLTFIPDKWDFYPTLKNAQSYLPFAFVSNDKFTCIEEDNNYYIYRITGTNIYLSTEVRDTIINTFTELCEINAEIKEALNLKNILIEKDDNGKAIDTKEIIKTLVDQNRLYSYINNQFVKSWIHVTVKALTGDDTIDLDVLREWKPEDFKNANFVADADGNFYCERRVEKMGKRYHNAINPDDVIADYSADTLRCYEMFLGPLEQSKPWDTKGIDGVHKFFRKMWRLFHSFDDQGEFATTQGAPTDAEQKIIHKAIKRVTEDLERFSFNTPVSTLMICVNELTDAKCNKHEILEKLLLIAAPYAPHIAEELWAKMGHVTSIHLAGFPTHDEKYLQESSFEYPISINGKKRTTINVPLDMPKEDIEKQVLANEIVQKWLEGKSPKKVIVVPKRIVNVVI